MNDIRKIAVGTDYKGSAMHYIVGQEVLGGSHVIHLIRQDAYSGNIIIWVQRNEEIFLWKEFTSSMPISIEYNINF